jgi:hypothetical protein
VRRFKHVDAGYVCAKHIRVRNGSAVGLLLAWLEVFEIDCARLFALGEVCVHACVYVRMCKA